MRDSAAQNSRWMMLSSFGSVIKAIHISYTQKRMTNSTHLLQQRINTSEQNGIFRTQRRWQTARRNWTIQWRIYDFRKGALPSAPSLPLSSLSLPFPFPPFLFPSLRSRTPSFPPPFPLLSPPFPSSSLRSRPLIAARESIANFLLRVIVKEFWKCFSICRSYGQEFGVLFFDSRCITLIASL